ASATPSRRCSACRPQVCRSQSSGTVTISRRRWTERSPSPGRWRVRNTARTVVVSAPALVVVAAAWLRLEQPGGSLGRVRVLLGLAPAGGAAAPQRRSLRLVCAGAATVAAARVAVGADLVPWRLSHPGSGFGIGDSFSNLGTRFGDGFTDFYGTHLPFDPR